MGPVWRRYIIYPSHGASAWTNHIVLGVVSRFYWLGSGKTWGGGVAGVLSTVMDPLR